MACVTDLSCDWVYYARPA